MAALTSPLLSLEELTLKVSSLAYTCSEALKTAGHAPLTTASDASAVKALPQDTRTQLCQTLMELHNLVLGPEDRLRRMAIEYSSPAALRYVLHFSIPSHVPKEGSISYDALAQAANVPEAHLKRVLRLAMTNDLFAEPTPNHVAHSPLSALLTTPALADYVTHCLEFSFPVAVKMPEMSEKWHGSEEKNQTAFNVAFDTELPMFGWLRGQPEHARRFAGLMGAMRSSPAWHVRHLVDGWDWASLSRGAKVVDVGGSEGHASVLLAQKYPELKFTVQDLEYVVQQTKEAKKIPEELSGRVELMAHDFFTAQPVKDGDVYLLRQILHDWPDAAAVQILKNIVPAMQKNGSRVLIMDQVVPAPGTLPKAQEREARTVDLVVMSHFNGKQRDMDDWKNVVQAANDGLRIQRVVQPKGSHFAIIEVVLDTTPVDHENDTKAPVVNGSGVNATAQNDQAERKHGDLAANHQPMKVVEATPAQSEASGHQVESKNDGIKVGQSESKSSSAASEVVDAGKESTEGASTKRDLVIGDPTLNKIEGLKMGDTVTQSAVEVA